MDRKILHVVLPWPLSTLGWEQEYSWGFVEQLKGAPER